MFLSYNVLFDSLASFYEWYNRYRRVLISMVPHSSPSWRTLRVERHSRAFRETFRVAQLYRYEREARRK